MRLLDTMVLIASLETEHPLHKRAMQHLRRASLGDVYVPSVAVLEMDLELKSHGFSSDERRGAGTALLGYVSGGKNLPFKFGGVLGAAEVESVSGNFHCLLRAPARLPG